MTAKPPGSRANTVGFSPRSAEPTRSLRQSVTAATYFQDDQPAARPCPDSRRVTGTRSGAACPRDGVPQTSGTCELRSSTVELVRGVVFFDVDGTLVPQTSSSEYLARFLGHAPEVGAAEEHYEAGRIDGQQWSAIDARGWTGCRPAQIEEFLHDLPLVDGIRDVVAWCENHRLLPVLATLAWQPVGRYLCARFGFARCCGPQLEVSEDRYTGGVAAHFDEYDKRDYALRLAREFDLTIGQCAAVGDSRSDVPLFEHVAMPIAFNAGPALQALARASVEGSDLRYVLPVLADWQTTLSH